MNKFTFVTSNKNKAREITEILSSGIKINEVELPEIQSLNLDEVIAAKARAAYRKIKKPVLVEDISFEIKAKKFFLQTLGTEGTVKLVGRSKTDTTVTAAIAIYDGKNFKIFKGKVSGTLSKKDKGIHGFGFDKVFIPKGYKHTYAQMPPSLKNEISHRAKALRKAKTYLKKTN